MSLSKLWDLSTLVKTIATWRRIFISLLRSHVDMVSVMAESGSCYVIHGDVRGIGLRRSTFSLKAPFTNLCNDIIQDPTSKDYTNYDKSEPLA